MLESQVHETAVGRGPTRVSHKRSAGETTATLLRAGPAEQREVRPSVGERAEPGAGPGEGREKPEGTEGSALLPSEEGESLIHRNAGEVTQTACTQEQSPRARNKGQRLGNPGVLEQSGGSL